MDLTLYFAYGSNLDPEQMRARCTSARPVTLATLPRHQLIFRGSSAHWGGAVASVRRAKQGAVRGVVYAMRSSDLRELDRFEGHPFYYERYLRTVVDDHGTRWQAHVYVLPVSRAPVGAPAERYLRVIADAYRRHGFDPRALGRALARSAH